MDLESSVDQTAGGGGRGEAGAQLSKLRKPKLEKDVDISKVFPPTTGTDST